MRKAVAYLAVSLDGYIADADGGVGWLGAFADEQEDRGYEAFVQSVDTVVMGGRTYRQVAEELSPGAWPYEGLDCWVWTQQNGPLPHARRIEGGLAAWLHAEKQKAGRGIWLCGGAALIAAASAAVRASAGMLLHVRFTAGGGLT